MYVYILKCSDNSYYTGVTNDLDKRIVEHNYGINKDCYTYTRRPLNLVFYEIFQNPTQAILWEKKIKGWSRAKKEALISSEFEKLTDLSKCKNESSSLLYIKGASTTLSETEQQQQQQQHVTLSEVEGKL